MPSIFGQTLSRADLERRVGDMSQLAGIRAMSLEDGRGRNARVLHVHTGSGLEFSLLADRCLDILDFRHNGRSMAWHSGVGPAAPSFYEPTGTDWLRTFFGGMLSTCGLQNAGGPNEDEGVQHGLHGRIGAAPARDLRWSAEWEGEDYVLRVKATMRESRVFGPRLALHRTVTTRLGSSKVTIEDTIENEGFGDELFMTIYHVNAGYPVLDEGSEVRIDSTFEGYDANAKAGIASSSRSTAPQHGVPEQVFIHDAKTDADGMCRAELVNARIGFGFRVCWRKRELPWLWQWKMMGERDYVMGLEPCNCGPGGRRSARESGRIGKLPPRGTVSHLVELEAISIND